MVATSANPDYSLQNNIKRKKMKGEQSLPASFRPWVCFGPSGLSWPLKRQGQVNLVVMEGFRPSDRGGQEP